MGNGPTEDEAEIIQHDQLSQHSEEEPEVKETVRVRDGRNTVWRGSVGGKRIRGSAHILNYSVT